MVFFNWATMQMAAKIVYYGPGLCGKTTNLSYIYSKTSPGSRGEMVSLETETDRTLFFDLLPLEVGKVGGFRTRLQLYTVPGQVFYNTTRKLVLKGVDGIVFVADSQRPMAEANIESMQNLEDNLRELGLDLPSLPLVLQYNKRDLKNVLEIEELNEALNGDEAWEHFEAIATQGDGVFETLKAVTKLTLKALRRRMVAQEEAPAAAAVVAPTRPFSPEALSAAAEQALEGAPPEAGPADAAAPVKSAEPAEEPAVAIEAESEVIPEAEELPPAEELPEAVEVIEPEEVDEIEAGAAGDEAAVEFATTRDVEEAAGEPEVRHVKVSSSLDILAELENLRKAATSQPGGTRRSNQEPAYDIDSLLRGSLNSRQEVKRRVEEDVGAALTRASRCLVRVELIDGAGQPVSAVDPLEIELKREEQLRHLVLNLTVDLHGE